MSSGGFTPESQVRPTTAVEVLTAIAVKIRTAIPAFASISSCFLTATPNPPPEIPIQGNLFCTVCMPDGQFDQAQMDGGANLQMCELATVIVTVYSRIEVDRIERFYTGLVDVNRGLLTMKQLVLSAIANKNLDGGPFAQGASSSSGSPDSSLLMEPLFCRSYRISDKEYDEFCSITLSFDAKFLWNTNQDSEFF